MEKKPKRAGKRQSLPSLEQLQRRYDEILALTDSFCDRYLNEDYRDICQDMLEELFDVDFALHKGKPAGWACAIVHAAGWVNFLHDPAQSPHMTSAQLAQGFGVSQGTMLAKSKLIRDELDIMPMDPDWCLPEMLERNPLVWMMEVNGFIMDVRSAPREVQEEAYMMGLIPYIPADKPEPQTEPDAGIKILEFPSRSKPPRKSNDSTMPLFGASDGQGISNEQ